jgi:hypothetical protein
MLSVTESSPVETIPDPDTVRSRLAQLASERALLRALLRLSKRKEQARARAMAQQREATR